MNTKPSNFALQGAQASSAALACAPEPGRYTAEKVYKWLKNI